MTELYEAADTPVNDIKTTPRWITVQKLAHSGAARDQKKLEKIIQTTAQATVRLPILRTAVATLKHPIHVKEGQTVILDLVSLLQLAPQHR